MDNLLMFGAIFLLKLAEASITEETRRQEEAHKRRLAEQIQRERMLLIARDAARVRQRRAALERLRLASADPRWQERIDLLLARTSTP